MDDKPRVQLESRAEWRAWLAANHRTSTGVWLVTWKRATGKPTVEYEDAVEEALCFGWIDGVIGRVDDERAMQWFAPRRPKGTWARSNKERVARLEAAGLMTEAGLAAVALARANGSWSSLDAIDELVVPVDLAAALAARPGARERFDASSVSVRKGALGRVYLAKRPQTRAQRVEQIADMAGRGEPIANLFQRRD
ncbi:MAG: YdeI family protein [Candidatus Limnocylindrales bacterium]